MDERAESLDSTQSHDSERPPALGRLIELFRSHVPDGALALVEAAPPTARRVALCELLKAHRPQVESFFRARSVRFTATLARLWAHAAPPADLLDVGCGSGVRTLAIARALGAPSRGVRGCDVAARWGPELPSFFLYDGRRLEACADGSFDLVTLNMVLHHCDAPESILREIRRVLRPGGRLLMREHDSTDRGFDLMLDEFHWLMRNVFGDAMPVVRYRPRAAWQRLFEHVGLRHVRGSTPEDLAAEDPILRGYADLFEVD